MTLVAVPIFVSSPGDVAAALERAGRAAAAGAQLVEWRVDLLPGEEGAAEAAGRLVRESPVPCIVTCRPRSEGGSWDGDEAPRLALLAAVAGADEPPRYVDVEIAALPAAAAVLRARRPGADPGVILSTHDFEGRPADLLQRVERMARADGADVVKLAWSARSVRDNLEAFDMLAERGRPMIALCMGPFGLMSRVLAPKFGALLTFAAVAPGGESAPGQPTIDDLRRRFRFDAIGPATRVYGVVGWPVDHSRSPDVHNAGFEAVGHDGVHLPLPVPPEYEHFKATVGSLVDHPRLDFAGASVTVPHKTHLLRFVRERDGTVDSLTDLVGAANTLVVRSDGSLAATNTDAGAALEALCAGMEIDEGGLAGRRVAVLGAGGVARAVTAGLARRGAAVSLFARDRDRAAALAGELHGRPATSGAAAEVVAPDPATLATDRYDVIVNGTPVGMAGGPAPDDSPLALLAGGDVTLDESTTVFDTVYTPERTPLIADAEARGARVVTGAEMFIRQAMRQFELWTGKPAPRAVFEHVLTARIG